MPGKYRMRSSYLIVVLLACSGCGDAASGEGVATATEQKAVPAAHDVAEGGRASNVKKAKKEQAGASAFGEEVLAYPDDLQMTMLAYRLTGRQPPLEDWANEDFDVRRADEFSKAQKLQEETGRLAAIYDATENVGYLQIRLNSQISQYDSAKGGYYLTAFSPGQQTSFSGREDVSLQLDNMNDAFFWAMDADQAREILAQTNRNVTIDMKVRLTGTQRRSAGILLKGTLVEYGIHSQRYNDERLLASFTL